MCMRVDSIIFFESVVMYIKTMYPLHVVIKSTFAIFQRDHRKLPIETINILENHPDGVRSVFSSTGQRKKDIHIYCRKDNMRIRINRRVSILLVEAKGVKIIPTKFHPELSIFGNVEFETECTIDKINTFDNHIDEKVKYNTIMRPYLQPCDEKTVVKHNLMNNSVIGNDKNLSHCLLVAEYGNKVYACTIILTSTVEKNKIVIMYAQHMHKLSTCENYMIPVGKSKFYNNYTIWAIHS
jgi:hypothetical protein